MKYEKEILLSFGKLGFTPRPGQVDAVSQILTAFIDDKKTDVCLSAQTGSGKSIIGVVVPEALNTILGGKNELRSVIGMHQNSLVEQYADTFDGHPLVMQIKGASNYACSVVNDTAEHCVSSSLHTMAGSQNLKEKHCNKCVFNQLKKKRNSIANLVTNYSFIFVDRMLAHVLDPRLCYVWDEAHTLNDVFTDHNTVFVSHKRLSDFMIDLGSYSIKQKLAIEIIKLSAQIKDNKVNDSNYIEFIKTLQGLYAATKSYFEDRMEDCIRRDEFSEFKTCSMLAKKYGNFCCKISDLLIYNYEHVFDCNTETKEFTIKAVFMGKMFDVLRNSKYNLFMSATLTEDYITTTMCLDPKTTAFIKLPSSFPKENKKILFVKPMLSLNYQSMQKKETIDAIQNAVIKIIKHHDTLNESGVIFVPSFKVGEMIATALRKSKPKMTIFEHVRGEKVSAIVSEFKNFNRPAVLISPSIFEGVDLRDDVSRFQIITKVPWPSLADKRMQLISTTYPKIYQAVTLHKVVQCLGRSIRSETDYATSYILDQHGYRLLTSNENIWFDEFSMNYLELKDL